MLNPEDDFVLEEKTCCSRQEAVAKCMGWLKGHRRRPFTEVTSAGISLDQLENMHSLGGATVMELLQDHRLAAQREFEASANAYDPVEIIQAKELVLTECDRRIDKAHSIFCSFDHEAAKGQSSMLQEDATATEHFGEKHYTLASVDAWTRHALQLRILDAAGESAYGLVDVGLKPRGAKDGLSKTEADNLYVTLGLLISHYVKIKGGPRLNKSGGGITKSAVLSDLQKAIADASNGKAFPGQGPRTLTGHIDEALRVKNDIEKDL